MDHNILIYLVQYINMDTTMPTEVPLGSGNLLAEPHTPYKAAVSTAWLLLLDKALNCQAALHLLQKHFSVQSTFCAHH